MTVTATDVNLLIGSVPQLLFAGVTSGLKKKKKKGQVGSPVQEGSSQCMKISLAYPLSPSTTPVDEIGIGEPKGQQVTSLTSCWIDQRSLTRAVKSRVLRCQTRCITRLDHSSA